MNFNNKLDGIRLNAIIPKSKDIVELKYRSLGYLRGFTTFPFNKETYLIFFKIVNQFCNKSGAEKQCEDYEIVATAGSDSASKHQSKHIKYPKKGFDLFKQLTEDRLGGGGIFTRQCLDWCKENITDSFDRIIVFSDSQDCDKVNKIPKPYGKYNYICDVSANTRGINFKNVWTAEISGWSEHFLTYIAAFEGIGNNFQES